MQSAEENGSLTFILVSFNEPSSFHFQGQSQLSAAPMPLIAPQSSVETVCKNIENKEGKKRFNL